MEKDKFTLPATRRITDQRIYSEIFRRGARLKFPEFVLIFQENGLPYSRIGISVGKRFGNAVRRNRAKRLCRELFRLNQYLLPQGVDIVFLPRQRLLETKWKKLLQNMQTAGRKIENRIRNKETDKKAV
ncbi:MAG: ribonuclease P protein component [Thermodesulfatator sp.]|nr:MAG: ribonuclease P protein component [Thermodesulfatator sp.]